MRLDPDALIRDFVALATRIRQATRAACSKVVCRGPRRRSPASYLSLRAFWTRSIRAGRRNSRSPIGVSAMKEIPVGTLLTLS